MKKISGKQAVFFFYIFDVILLLILVLAFLPMGKKKKVYSSETALLNPNYTENVRKIKISGHDSDGEQVITLFKEPNVRFWVGTDSYSANTFVWPANNKAVQTLISEASEIKKVSLKSKSLSSWDNLGVDEKNAVSVIFYDENDSILSWIYFGFEDPLSKKIAFRTWQEQTVYEISSDIKNYLSVDESFWADANIYPQILTPDSDEAEQNGLRRGKLEPLIPREGIEPLAVKEKHFGNGSTAKFAVYKRENDYMILPVFKAGPDFSSAERSVIQKINYRYSVSEWTYSRLMEEDK